MTFYFDAIPDPPRLSAAQRAALDERLECARIRAAGFAKRNGCRASAVVAAECQSRSVQPAAAGALIRDLSPEIGVIAAALRANAPIPEPGVKAVATPALTH